MGIRVRTRGPGHLPQSESRSLVYTLPGCPLIRRWLQGTGRWQKLFLAAQHGGPFLGGYPSHFSTSPWDKGQSCPPFTKEQTGAQTGWMSCLGWKSKSGLHCELWSLACLLSVLLTVARLADAFAAPGPGRGRTRK